MNIKNTLLTGILALIIFMQSNMIISENEAPQQKRVNLLERLPEESLLRQRCEDCESFFSDFIIKSYTDEQRKACAALKNADSEIMQEALRNEEELTKAFEQFTNKDGTTCDQSLEERVLPRLILILEIWDEAESAYRAYLELVNRNIQVILNDKPAKVQDFESWSYRYKTIRYHMVVHKFIIEQNKKWNKR